MLSFLVQTLTAAQAVDLFSKGVATAVSILVASSKIKEKR